MTPTDTDAGTPVSDGQDVEGAYVIAGIAWRGAFPADADPQQACYRCAGCGSATGTLRVTIVRRSVPIVRR